MKKIGVLLLVINLFVSTYVVAAEPAAYFLRPENFLMDGFVKRELQDADLLPGTMLYSQEVNGTETATAKIYVKSEANYAILTVGKDTNDTLFGQRGVDISIDDVKIPYRFGNVDSRAQVGWSWDDGAPTVFLSVGWHTLELSAPSSYTRIGGVFITSQAEYNLETAAVRAFEDLNAPSVTGLTQSAATETSLTLTWEGDADVYDIYRDGNKLATIFEKSYLDRDLLEGSYYDYIVKGYDVCGNTASVSLKGKTVGAEDTEAPVWPEDATFTKETTPVSGTFTWPEATDNRSVTEYEVYLDGVFQMNTTNTYHSVSDIVPGSSLELSVKALDKAGNKSVFLTENITFPMADMFLLRSENMRGEWQRLEKNPVVDAALLPPADTAELSYYLKTDTPKTLTASIYAEAEGNYTPQLLTKDGEKVSLSINGNPIALELPGEESGWVWDTYTDVQLAQGWNYFEMTPSANGGILGAISLIKNGCFNIGEVTDYDRILKPYDDVTKPDFKGEIVASYENDALKLTWDTDHLDVKEYVIEVNESVYKTKGKFFVIDFYSRTSALSIRVTAHDQYENASSLMLQLCASPLQFSKFEIKKNNLSIALDMAYTSIGTADAIQPYLAAFHPTTGRMVALGENAITLPDAKTAYLIKAGVWDSTMQPLIRGIHIRGN